MKKSTIIAASIAALMIAIPTSAHAYRCCFLRPLFPRVAYRVGFWRQAEYRVGVVAPCAPCAAVGSTCENGACNLTVSTPAPCEPVEACAPVVSTPAPCEPVGTCENGACYIEKTTVPAPCEPVGCETVGEYIPTDGGSVAVAVNEMIEILNETRARYGLTAFVNDATLEAGAVRQARICAYSGRLTHGAGVAEILALNAQGLRVAVRQWLDSPAHRSLLLNGGYRYAGVAVVRDNQGRAWCAVRFR